MLNLTHSIYKNINSLSVYLKCSVHKLNRPLGVIGEPCHRPGKQGLYDPQYEKEACGIGFIVSVDGTRSHKLLRNAETLSMRMVHRGGRSSDNNTGDGTGMITAIPQNLYAKELKDSQNVVLPAFGKYATGIFFMDKTSHQVAENKFEKLATDLGLKILAWRSIPVNSSVIGRVAKRTEPLMRQVFVAPQEGKSFSEQELDVAVYMLRKRATHTIEGPDTRFYVCSLFVKTIVYKGLFTADQFWGYFLDLSNPLFDTYLALMHIRFSTNTFPSWERAQPLRMIAHNGEINTLQGNLKFMTAREGIMKSDKIGDKLQSLYPVVEPDLSDSGSTDCVLEFLVKMGKRSLPEAVLTMVPEAWQNDPLMSAEKKDFYHWASFSMEPWDGPAFIIFTDGKYIGGILDRNGLRPSRIYITKDNIMVMASEVGVYDTDPANVILKSRLKPGRMILVDVENKTVFQGDEIIKKIAKSRPYSQWLKEQIQMDELRKAHTDAGNSLTPKFTPSGLSDKRLSLYNYTNETIYLLLFPMINDKKEALGSMGNDAPLACLSPNSPLMYAYFKQLFAQVTNPPIDLFREKVIMSLQCPIGPVGNILEPSPKQVHRLWLNDPILSLSDLEVLKKTTYKKWSCHVLDATFPVADGPAGLSKALQKLCEEAKSESMNHQLLVISDRQGGQDRVPISSLLALGAIHHHLLEIKRRLRVALIVETAEAREVHQICLLLGYGADAICPYLVFELAASLREDHAFDAIYSDDTIFQNYSEAIQLGILKVMAKMGISTLQSYKGAQIFEAIGLADDVINKCFRGTPSRIGGITLEHLAAEAFQRHHRTYCAYPDNFVLRNIGDYHWRAGGVKHLNSPAGIAALQEASANNNNSAYNTFRKETMNSVRKCMLRGQLELRTLDTPLPLTEIEPAIEIIKRFATGGMSLGSISSEAHQAVSIGMNRAGGKSNSGEGGEDSTTFVDPMRRSAVKQLASGRFGVTSSYLAHCDIIQVKMAQGAKPGEGGELPGYKVTPEVAKCRRSVPGIGVISPPPHHDIYSIEDLAELIYDLKCANPKACISVKLTSEVGVGVVASGVAKAKAEHIVVCGHDGGTGANSWTGIKCAGLPWELGLAETHQVLVLNNLRSRVKLQVDGQIRTGFDLVVAALLGADEIAFSTVPLIILGCTMMRKCHLNTCPVGIATQDPALRRKFTGQPDHIVNYLFMLAEDVRNVMASLGVRKYQELIGRTDLLRASESGGIKAKSLNLSLILQNALDLRPGVSIVGGSLSNDFELEKRLDNQLYEKSKEVIEGDKNSVDIDMIIKNENRAFGTTLSYHISNKYKEEGLPKGKSINIKLKGSAGQSFGAFLQRGVHITLEGDANDYLGKGLSGGEIVVYPPKSSPFESHLNVIAGNVCLFGATSGRVLMRGIASERFCVRNSGVTAVVEGVGDHGCQCMSSGTVLILGRTGKNFGAGMSGGIAYVWDIDGSFKSKHNPDMIELCSLEDEDTILVKDLLKEFMEKTGSVRAEKLLKEWETYRSQFVKVFPYEYQRVLKVKKATQKPVVVTDLALKHRKMDKLKAFMRYPRETKPYRPAEKRIKDWDEVHNHTHVRKGLKVQAARCMDCGIPFCQSNRYGCPLGNIVPKWNLLVYQNQWKDALSYLLQTNNFPEFTGRVCPAPCETACVLGISDPSVTIKNIECSIIDNAFEQGWIVPHPPKARSGKSVAVVGSGPAGLACAHQLNKAGHLITVLERNDRVGGLLQYGIPTMKIDKKVVQRRVDLLAAEGIVFKTKVNVGKDISAKELSEKYDAVVLCMGATLPRDLPLPGRQLGGIHFAMDFLESWQKKQLGGIQPHISAKDKHVVIIGGGDTSCDCIATSLRQGAAKITALEMLPKPKEKRDKDNPWPQWPKTFNIDYVHKEMKVSFGADPRQFGIMAEEFLDNGSGQVSEVKAVAVEGDLDAAGHLQMKLKPGLEETFKADLVILAVGFLGPELDIANELQLKLDSKNYYDAKDYKTRINNVFAAGDCRRGNSLVVWAISEGRQAARQVDKYLSKGATLLPGPGGII